MRKESGSALILTAAAIVLLVAVVGVAFNLTSNVGRGAQRSTIRQNATAIADGALELEFAEWKAICENGIQFAPGSASFDTISLPTASMFASATNFTVTRSGSSGFTLSNYKIQAVDSMLVPLTNRSQSPPAVANIKNSTAYNYLATATVTLPAQGKQSVTVSLGRVLQLITNSPWNYALFFDGDLEINPGPNMTINGDVHTNDDLYVGAGGGTITFSSGVEASGNISVGKSPLDPSSRNNHATPNYPPGYPIPSVSQESPLGVNHGSLSTTDANPNNDSYHEVVEKADSSYSDPFSATNSSADGTNKRFYDAADFKVIIGTPTGDISASNPTVTILDKNNNVVSTTVSDAFTSGFTVGSGRNAQTYQILTLNGSLTDGREGATMVTTTVDVSALKAAITKNIVQSSTNGLLLYIVDQRPTKSASAGSSSKKEPAIKLTNGGILPDNGLTIATPNPVYVQGDYNTGGTSPSTLASNKTNGGANTVGSYWVPAAIVTDAINILSNSWTSSSTSSSKASATTINAAIMAGNVPSNGVNYSGGAENFLRLHEDWSNVTLTFYGSMVCIYQSKQATGPWGSNYQAPYRYWNYDKNLRTRTPPGTFLSNRYSRERWFVNQ